MSTPGLAVPGTNVPANAQVSPGGAQGVTGISGTNGTNGLPAFNTTTTAFTIPAIGATVTVTLADASWCEVGATVMVAGADGAGNAAGLQITAIAGNTLTLLNPTPPGSIPVASPTTQGLMNQLSGNTTDYVGGDNACHPIGQIQNSAIWSVRLNSYNAAGNPNFECSQRAPIGTVATLGSAWPVDRWLAVKNGMGTAVLTATQTAAPSGIIIPGTSFAITAAFLRITLTTQQTSLAAGDYLYIDQNVEGIKLRELIGGAHSLQILARSSVANLQFAAAIRDSVFAYSLTELCSLGAANTWTTLPFPNLPIWTPSGTFPLTPGNIGYALCVCLAAGSTFVAPANGVWAAGNFIGAPGMNNFAASPVNATFDLAFIQHEPGSVCSQLMDLDFQANLDQCLRYYEKSWQYGVAPGTSGQSYCIAMGLAGNTVCRPAHAFRKEKARVPTATIYSYTGAINTIYQEGPTQAQIGVASGSAISTIKIQNIALASAAGGTGSCYFLYEFTADTGL